MAATQDVTFRSRTHNLRVVRVPARDGMPDPLTGERPTVPGLVYEFKDFKLVVDDALVERDRRYFQERADGAQREFDGDPGTVEWLRAHAEKRREDFFEIPLSEMAPPSGDALRRVSRLTAQGHRDQLRDVLEEERATYQREDVIEAAEESLATFDEMEAALTSPETG